MEKRDMVFSLSKPLKYTKKGDFQETHEITLGAPCVKAFKASAKFAQHVTRAFLQMQQQVDPEQAKAAIKAAKEAEGQRHDEAEGEMDASAVKLFLFGSDEDLEQVFEAFKGVAVMVGKVDDTTPLIHNHFDSMDYNDVIRMMCEYAANFTVPSLFAE